MKRFGAVLCALALGSVTACGADEESAGSDGGGRGPIVVTEFQSNAEATQAVIDAWNEKHPDQKATLDVQPADADGQRQRLINNARTKSDAMDVILLDVVWTAEFAANRWIEPLDQELIDAAGLIDATARTGEYRGNTYSMPWRTGTGLLFYRKDLVRDAPTTWAEMEAACAKVLPKQKGMDCYAGQLDKYEGLTVNFSEAVQSAGGSVLDGSGKPSLDTSEAKAGLEFLVDGLKSGRIPEKGITYQEDQTKNALASGGVLFGRSWAGLYTDLNAPESEVSGKIGVAPLPGLDGLGSGTLGGNNLAISSFSKHKETARDFIRFVTSAEQMKAWATSQSTPVTRASLYEDPELVEMYPYLPALKEGIEEAAPRPVAVKYGDVTAAIQDAVYPALTGETEPDEALDTLQRRLTELLAE